MKNNKINNKTSELVSVMRGSESHTSALQITTSEQIHTHI